MSYKRILLKLSGEGLAAKEKSLAIDFKLVENIVSQIKAISQMGIEVCIVVGGGNFWRGVSAAKNGIPRNRADYIGMLATLMNALALQSGIERAGLSARIQSSLNIDAKVAENYINEKTNKYLRSGEIVIFAGGTGRPYFTTDTAAALFASEVNVDAIFMGKNNVDGIYDKDPRFNEDAKRFENITYDEILQKHLSVMDLTATAMAADNNVEIVIFDIAAENSILRAVQGKIKMTKVGN